jgi:hypothetical protein
MTTEVPPPPLECPAYAPCHPCLQHCPPSGRWTPQSQVS